MLALPFEQTQQLIAGMALGGDAARTMRAELLAKMAQFVHVAVHLRFSSGSTARSRILTMRAAGYADPVVLPEVADSAARRRSAGVMWSW